jgi:hypothetical protein
METDKTIYTLKPRCPNYGASINITFHGKATGSHGAEFKLPGRCEGCIVSVSRRRVGNFLKTEITTDYTDPSTCIVPEVRDSK